MSHLYYACARNLSSRNLPPDPPDSPEAVSRTAPPGPISSRAGARLPVDVLAFFLGPLESFGWFLGTCLDVAFRAHVSFVKCLRTILSSRHLPPDPPDLPGRGVKNCTTKPHIHMRRGPGWLWMSFGILLWPAEVPLFGFWTPVDALWTILSNWGSLFEQMSRLYHAFRQNLSSRNLPPDPPDRLEAVPRTAPADPISIRAVGQAPCGCPLGSFGGLESLWLASGHLWIPFGQCSRIGHHFPNK